MVEIKHNPRGYYTLYVDGRFGGNFDTYGEARREYEEEYENAQQET